MRSLGPSATSSAPQETTIDEYLQRRSWRINANQGWSLGGLILDVSGKVGANDWLTLVMGYHRPVASFNTGKQGKFNERLHIEESRAALAAA